MSSDDGMVYPLQVNCGCIHFYYRDLDNYVHTVLCSHHRWITMYPIRKRQPMGDGTELEPQRG